MSMAASSLFFIFLFFVFHLVVQSEEKASNHPTCHPFNCGNLTNIQFPFSNETNPECGAYAILCSESIPMIRSGGRSYIVKNISYEEQTIVAQDGELNYPLESKVCNLLYNFTLPIFGKRRIDSPMLTFFNCEGDKHTHHDNTMGLINFTHCNGSDLYYFEGAQNFSSPLTVPDNCSAVQFPVFKPNPPFDDIWPDNDLMSLLAAGFLLDWNVSQECHDSFFRGCYCHENEAHSLVCQGRRSSGTKRKVTIGISAGIGSILAIACFLIVFFYISRILSTKKSSSDNSTTVDTQNVEVFLKKYGSLAPRRYTYSDLKKMTNSFGDKCGEGGFGSVFKGNLPNGRLVAVKVLSESKGNGEEFINEVASIGSTSHVNIVRLLGFCSERTKRALIYEFMSNGSLEKFIFADGATVNDPLGWEKLYEIAVGIARGLEYLHRGCNMRILHFDIKPHNVLLDQDFCPKISDFGLAKLYSTKDSVVSMHGARGTLGYTAPEVYCRNFGGVSYKSDVYSYGMMVLEMVGGRKNLDCGVVNMSEIYFPQWIYKHFDLNSVLALQGVMTEEDVTTARKMVMVGLWCIQTDPANRPSMSRVVEMLEGTVEVLPMPPDPFQYNRIIKLQSTTEASTTKEILPQQI